MTIRFVARSIRSQAASAWDMGLLVTLLILHARGPFAIR
jgi:hypothetical protein